MQEYKVFQTEGDVNEKLVFITCTEDLYYLQDDIYDDLSRIYGPSFSVLVDLFLRNGYSFNRFVSLQYKGRNDCSSLIVNPREVSEELKAKIRSYLNSHSELLSNSALTESTIKFVTKTD